MSDLPNDHPIWWQWPTVLSLDAPIVALVWQALFAQVANAHLLAHHSIILGAVTWLVYAADRWTEGFEIKPERVQTQRHRFYQRYRLLFALAICMVAVATFLLALTALTAREWRVGLALAAPVAAYLAIGPLLRRFTPWRLPKEVLIALLFAAGSACFPFANATTNAQPLFASVAWFVVLCFVNLALIAHWEREVDAAHGHASLALAHPWVNRWIRIAPWLLAICAGGAGFQGWLGPIFATRAIGLSALLMALLDRAEPRLGRRPARVLVDTALLTPLLFLF